MRACGTADKVRRSCLGGALPLNAFARTHISPPARVNSLAAQGVTIERMEIGPRR